MVPRKEGSFLAHQLGPGTSGCVGSNYFVENGLAVLCIQGKHCLQEMPSICTTGNVSQESIDCFMIET